MNYKYIIYLIYLGLYQVISAPTEETFYDAIVGKCPLLKTDANFKGHPIFKTCKDWKNISVLTQFKDNGKEIRCLLYYKTFTAYCTVASKVVTKAPPEELVKYSIDNVCGYAKNISDSGLKTIFLTGDNCVKICTDELAYINPVCSTSFYFANLIAEAHEGTQTDKEPKNPTLETKGQASPIDAAQNIQTDPNLNNDNNRNVNDQSNLNPSKTLNSDPAMLQKSVQPNRAFAKDETTTSTQINEVQPAASNKNVIDHSLAEAKPDDTAEVNPNTQSVKNSESKITLGHDVNPIDQVNDQTGQVHKPDPNVHVNGNQEIDLDPNVPVGDKEKTGPVEPKQDVAPETPDQEKLEQTQQVNEEAGPDDDLQMGSDGMDDDTVAQANSARDEKSSKPMQIDESEPVSYNTEMEADSYFFTYFMLLCIIFIVGYVCYHNKQKILALVLEGRKGRRQYRGRRPNSANYHKLDSNLEEAITSSCKKNANNVIY